MIAKTLKHSKQRDSLMMILQNTKSHPSAEWLYGEMKKEFPNISLATVYRNLSLLNNTKLIQCIHIGSGTEHYDANVHNHYHFVCKKCNSIIDLNLPPIPHLEEVTEKMNHVSIDGHSLIFYGLCSKCKKA